MSRVHEGVPVKALPMVLPAPAKVIFGGDVNEVAPIPNGGFAPASNLRAQQTSLIRSCRISLVVAVVVHAAQAPVRQVKGDETVI